MNVDTASETELRTLLTIVLDDADAATDLAKEAIGYRSYRPEDEGERETPRYTGCRTVGEFVEWTDENSDDGLDEPTRIELRGLIRI